MEKWNIGKLENAKALIITKSMLETFHKENELEFVCYDNPVHTVWAGGRPMVCDYGPEDPDSFFRDCMMCNSFGVGLFFTFSNLLVKEEHLNEELGNRVLSSFHAKGNGVICGSDVLAKYIRKRYPKYTIVGSVTRPVKTAEDIKRTLDLYDRVVLPPELNRDFDFLETLKDDVNKIEILVNEVCMPNCPYKKHHYTLISKFNMCRDFDEKERLGDELHNYCGKRRFEKAQKENLSSEDVVIVDGEIHRADGLQLVLSVEDVNRLKALGIIHFKISARDVTYEQFLFEYDKYVLGRHGMSALHEQMFKQHTNNVKHVESQDITRMCKRR